MAVSDLDVVSNIGTYYVSWESDTEISPAVYYIFIKDLLYLTVSERKYAYIKKSDMSARLADTDDITVYDDIVDFPSVQTGTTGVILTWDYIPDVTTYLVEKSISGSWIKQTNVPDTSWIYTGGVDGEEAQFRVSGVAEDGSVGFPRYINVEIIKTPTKPYIDVSQSVVEEALFLTITEAVVSTYGDSNTGEPITGSGGRNSNGM